MESASEIERVIIMTGTGIIPEGDRMQVHNIQVRRGVPLPDLGQRVVAMDEHRIIKFAGEVIKVYEESRTYDVELRKSIVVLAPSFHEVAGRPSSDPKNNNGNEGRRVV